MSAEWPEVRLEDITSILGDGLHGTPVYDPFGDYYFINGNNLRNGKIEVDDKTKRVSKEEYLKYRKNLNDRTILVSINGTIGNVGLYDNEKVILGKSACYFNVREGVDKQFVRYVITGSKFQDYIHSLATGSTIKNVSLKLMRNFTFRLPPIDIQKDISKVLEDLDNKIELNRQINQTLEQIAQTIFKSWFVDFEPVKAKIEAKAAGRDPERAAMCAISGKLEPELDQLHPEQYQQLAATAALFPDELVESELGLIPEGWEVQALGSVCQVINGRAYKNSEFKDTGTPIVRIQNLSSGGKTVYSDIELPEEKIINKEDLIYAWSATFGPHIWRGPRSIYHYHIWKLVPDLGVVDKYYLFNYLSKITELMKNSGTGSIFTHLTKSMMESQKILVPPTHLKDFLSKRFHLIYGQISSNIWEADTLASLRDTLLPKLLSGELATTVDDSLSIEQGRAI